MKAKKIVARIYERIYPERVEQIKANERARRTAMSAMLATNNYLRANRCDVETINYKMHDALRFYARGKYDVCLEILPR